MSKLYVTAVPIGNKDDITIRALNVLKAADIIIGEEKKIIDKMLKSYGIFDKITDELNEHNSEEKTNEILELIKSGKTAALTSDHGTPVISDPGWILVDLCHKNKISVEAVPGVSSVTAALSVAGIKVDEYVFFSRIPRNSEERKHFFINLRKNRQPKVFIETPYRLLNLLEFVYHYLSKDSYAVLCYQLTMPDEIIFRGRIDAVISFVKEKKIKGEFILIVK